MRYFKRMGFSMKWSGASVRSLLGGLRFSDNDELGVKRCGVTICTGEGHAVRSVHEAHLYVR